MTCHLWQRYGAGTPLRCLVADDDPSFQSIASYTLRRVGIEVVLASSGPEVFAQVEQNRLDVCLLDQRLPDTTGCAVLRELRSRQIHTPVVIVSGAASVQEVVEAMRLGAFDFVEKPIPVGALVESVILASNSVAVNAPSNALSPPTPALAELLAR